ncbi:MAG TPA: alcohol dehydrogenase catalytic domain-containing protein, partial [Pseudonocardia sp.]
MELMRAVVLDRFGGPEVLTVGQRPLPEPLPTEVRVRVAAAGVNPIDGKTRSGQGMARFLGDLPFVLGWDIAGEVEAVGVGVTRFEVGDQVFGMPRFPRLAGCYAEYVTAPSRQLAKLPAGLDHVGAAALPLAALTA